MRSESTATWTSGEPVSPSPLAYCVITSFLRSAVTDIDLFLLYGQAALGARSEIEYPERPELALGNFGERYWLASGRREIDRPTLEIRSRFSGSILQFHQARQCGARMRTELPLRRRTESGSVTASAGMPSSAVAMGLS